VWEQEDRLDALMMGMRRNDKDVLIAKQSRKCSSDSSSSADSGNGKQEVIKEEEKEEESEDEDQFEKLQGVFQHQEMQRMTQY
jgi:ribosomal protein L12E/L44/L45/RPP1/RPP2